MAGKKGEYLYYVHQGEARLMRTTLDGREKDPYVHAFRDGNG